MIILPKNYYENLDCVSVRGAEARIYVDKERQLAYKIYRDQGYCHLDEKSINRFKCITHLDCIKPLDLVSTEENPGLVIGHSMEFVPASSLPFMRGANIEALMKASLEIFKVVKDISRNKFMIRDHNTQNYAYSRGSFKFFDVSFYAYLKYSIQAVLYKWNLIIVNDAIVSGLVGFSYKKLVPYYLDIVAPELKRQYEKCRLTDDDFVYKVLSLLLEASKEASLDEVKLKLLTPISRG